MDRGHGSTFINLVSPEELVQKLLSVGCDINVKIQGKSCFCHKATLAASSRYFHDKLRDQSQQITLIEENGNWDAFKLVQRYIYTGTVANQRRDDDFIASVLCLSVRYNLEALTEYMSAEMKNQITMANVVQVFRRMSDIQLQSVTEYCLQYIRNRDDEFLKSGSYLYLTMKQLVDMLKLANLNTEIHNGVTDTWIQVNREHVTAEEINETNVDHL